VREYDIDFLESELESLKNDIRDVVKTNPAYYVKLTGVSKQHLSYLIHNQRGMSLPKMKHVYQCIQADMNKC
jgi:hypothetical protein